MFGGPPGNKKLALKMIILSSLFGQMNLVSSCTSGGKLQLIDPPLNVSLHKIHFSITLG